MRLSVSFFEALSHGSCAPSTLIKIGGYNDLGEPGRRRSFFHPRCTSVAGGLQREVTIRP